jgi:capsule polysaccharide export protein KpsE/RkpR
VDVTQSREVKLENSGSDNPRREGDGIAAVTLSYGREEHSPEPPWLGGGWTSYCWLLWDKRSLLYRVTVRALVLSTLLVLLIPSKYESTAHIMPPQQNGGALLSLLAGRAGGSDDVASALPSLAGNFLGMTGSGAMFIGLIHSRTVEDHIVDRFDLRKVYWTRNIYSMGYKQDARNTLERNTDVEEDRKSGVISIAVTDRSPQRARDIAQAYVEELDGLLAQVSTSSARRERIFIEQRLVTVKRDLENAEQQFSAFASKNSAPDIKEQAKAMVESAAVLQGQVIAAQSELQGLEQIYTSNNVRVRSLQARVAELQSQLQKLGGTDASLAADATTPEQLYPSIRKLPLLGVGWADLYRNMKIQETVYELLTQQYELARIQEAREIPTLRVIDAANVPERKSGPHRLLIIVMLTTLSFALAVAWITGAAYWRKGDQGSPGKLLANEMWGAASRQGHQIIGRLRLHGLVSRLFAKRKP